MKFNSTASRDGMIQMCEDLLGFDNGGISGSTDLLRRFTRLLNDRYNLVSNKINKSSSDWQYDDTNASTLPFAYTDLVDAQQDYVLPSTAQKLLRVEVLNQNGDAYVLKPFDEAQIESTAMTEWYETAGSPIYYDLKGRSLILYPKPGAGYVTLTAGLRVYVERNVTEFNSTATTQEPGFSVQFHRLLPLGACIDYAVGKSMESVAKNCIYLYQETEKDLEEFYAKRHKNPPKTTIKVKSDNFI